MKRVLAPAVFALFFISPCALAAAPGDTLTLGNDRVQRQLTFDGKVWRTTRFSRPDGANALPVQSDEFHILLLNNAQATIADYVVDGEPVRGADNTRQSIAINYAAASTLAREFPARIQVRYELDGLYLRKTLTCTLNQNTPVDRLEVERFTADAPQSRGGRGEPVFVNAPEASWFFGVEYPAAYSRHTDGNTPAAASGPYDKFGNYSFIDLENRDVEPQPKKGLIRLFHFPGMPKQTADGKWEIVSKTAVAGPGNAGESLELAFEDYLATIRRPVRSFVHFNNWYSPDAKKLMVENFVNNTYIPFRDHLQKYDVHIDAMVPDDGWQNKKSVYAPNPAQFPNGMSDMAGLADALRKEGAGMGLWIALNGYNSDIDWGVSQGFAEAVRNTRFRQFKRYYSLTNEKYNAALREQITQLMKQCRISYFKHDFNEMCDLSEGNGHLPDDRHGHEAQVDAELSILALERRLNPDIYQNITNWIWFSPFWLQQGNSLWMLSNDSGEFTGIPEPSLLIRATAYRDVNIWKVWHDPQTRPLVPVSHLMTHGIIYTKGHYAGAGDSLHDFADYVMMYHMRGLQLKEWYIDPHLLSDDQWQVLARATRWSQENMQTLANALVVGGDPAKAEPYGYIAWNGDKAILSVRNPAPTAAPISVPFDQSVWYRGAAGKPFHARAIYPFQSEQPGTFTSGKPITLTVPGYALMTFEITPGPSTAPEAKLPPPPGVANGAVAIPDENMQRADILIIARGKPDAGKKALDPPQLKIDGQLAAGTRTASAATWSTAMLDVRTLRGKRIQVDAMLPAGAAGKEAWLILDRPVADSAPQADATLPMPVSQGYRRQTVNLLGN